MCDKLHSLLEQIQNALIRVLNGVVVPASTLVYCQLWLMLISFDKVVRTEVGVLVSDPTPFFSCFFFG